jgi:hypothetical protein
MAAGLTGCRQTRHLKGELPPGCRTFTSDLRIRIPATLHCEGSPPLLFTENETNTARLYADPNGAPYTKDAFTDT